MLLPAVFTLFFFNDTATTEIYTLSLHDALPISPRRRAAQRRAGRAGLGPRRAAAAPPRAWTRLAALPGRQLSPDRKSTRLNSSHQIISYAVFCLKKKKRLHHGRIPHRARRSTHA